MSIKELHERLKRREVSSRELTEDYLRRIKQSSLNAFVCVTEEQAAEQARCADRLIGSGEDFPMLCGIPMSLKDNICTSGIETTCCSRMLIGHKPAYDATAARLLLEQGAVLLGKTNMDEFAMGSSTKTSCFGGTRNPLDASLCAGGSSGGSAAAVAGGLCAYSIGSDTGGSVRQPASFCGCVGFKPTYGAFSRFGLIAFASGLDQLGILAGCAQDAREVTYVLRHADRFDDTSLPEDYEFPSDIRGRKLLICEELWDGAEAEVISAVEETASVMSRQGFRLERISIPELRAAGECYCVLACAQASSNLARYDGIRYGARGEGSSADALMTASRALLGQEVRRRILAGTFVLSVGGQAEYYQKALRLRRAISAQLEEALRDAYMLSPTAPYKAFPFDETPDFISLYSADRFTVAANLASLPAVSFPTVTDRGIGCQLMGAKGSDLELLALAELAEKEGRSDR